MAEASLMDFGLGWDWNVALMMVQMMEQTKVRTKRSLRQPLAMRTDLDWLSVQMAVPRKVRTTVLTMVRMREPLVKKTCWNLA